MENDPYSATASAYDLFSAPYQAAQFAALAQVLPRLRADAGPILDIGAGSGAISARVLGELPAAQVVALEPSTAMRALLLGRIAGHPEWFPRITVRPESFFDAELPDTVGGAIMLGVIGHFDTGERLALLAELARRMPSGAAVLVDLQHPQRPERVEPYEFTAAMVGDIEYRGIAEAVPVDDETMRWRMTYLAIAGERVLTEDTIEHVYRHPDPMRFKSEAAAAGFDAEPLSVDTFWVLTRHE